MEKIIKKVPWYSLSFVLHFQAYLPTKKLTPLVVRRRLNKCWNVR